MACLLLPLAHVGSNLAQPSPTVAITEDLAAGYSPLLIDALTARGQLELEQGNFGQAAATFADARHLVRINQGFSTPEELFLLWRTVQATEAAGNWAEAWELERSLQTMALQHESSQLAFGIFHELAQKRLDVLRRYSNGEFPPQLYLGCYYGAEGFIDSLTQRHALISTSLRSSKSCNAGNRVTVKAAMLLEARAWQAKAIGNLLTNGLYTSAELQQEVTGFIRSSLDIQALLPRYSDPAVGEVLNPVLHFDASDTASRRRQAEFLLQVADLNVLRLRPGRRYPQYESVLDQYRQAHALLQHAGASREELAELFAPELPVALPAQEANPLASPATTAPDRFMVATFTISTRGVAEDVRIVEAGADIGRADRKQLTSILRTTTFRPRMADDGTLQAAKVAVRYQMPTLQD